MPKVEAPEIPESFIEFAKAVASAANEHGVDSFTMSFKPDFNTEYSGRRLISGDIRIGYSRTDGRGRPCENLKIELDARLCASVISSTDSY